jgi:hypothetical protein
MDLIQGASQVCLHWTTLLRSDKTFHIPLHQLSLVHPILMEGARDRTLSKPYYLMKVAGRRSALMLDRSGTFLFPGLINYLLYRRRE